MTLFDGCAKVLQQASFRIDMPHTLPEYREKSFTQYCPCPNADSIGNKANRP